MKTIDLETWNRKEHFNFFKRMDLPFYNVNVNIDVSGLKETSRKKNISLNCILIYLTMKAINNVENFRYRIRGDSVILHEKLNPSFAHLKSGDDLFRMITVDFSEDLNYFEKKMKKEIENSKSYFDFSKLEGRDDFVFISVLPWIEFTGIDHTLSFKKEDTIPRITWGKIYNGFNGMILPYNIQVNHILVDGIHVNYFFKELSKEIRKFINE